MTLLVLGGTQEGKRVARRLHQAGLQVIYSIAGLVRSPDLPCPVISGGFTQFGGFSQYLQQHSITAIIDATHPYATTMTTTAITAVQQLNQSNSRNSLDDPQPQLGYWRIHRAPWQPEAEDHWTECQSWTDVVRHLDHNSRVFLTCGQLTDAELTELPIAYGLYRTAVDLNQILPNHLEWLEGIGPFNYDDELALLKNRRINVLVTKNSGGAATAAKLLAARQLGIRVLMLARPYLDIMGVLSHTKITQQQLQHWRYNAEAPLRCVTNIELCCREVQAVYRDL